MHSEEGSLYDIVVAMVSGSATSPGHRILLLIPSAHLLTEVSVLDRRRVAEVAFHN